MFLGNEEKENNPKKEKDENDDFYDIITKEELIKARNSFTQLNYVDLESDIRPKSLSYNLFIPENYTKNTRYPLILFISDESFIGNEVTSPLSQTKEGPIWASDLFQTKNKYFVLIPKYNETIIDDENKLKSEYLNITKRLIIELINKFNIDKNRIYGIGQSTGTTAIFYLLSNKINILNAGLIIEGNYIHDKLPELINTTFTYISSKENEISLNEIKNFFDSNNINYGFINNISYKEDIEILNQKLNNMYNNNYQINFITYSKWNNFAYKIETIRDWLFLQNKVKCKEGYFYSKEEGKCFTNTKKKVLFLIQDLSKTSNIILDLLNNFTFISEITIKSYKDAPKMNSTFLSSFDCVVYDIFDAGNKYPINNDEEIETYIKNGGSFLVTHDRWDGDYGPLYLLDCERNNRSFTESYSTKVKVSYYNHPILDSYYDLTNWNVINISQSHKTYHEIIDRGNNTVNVVMEFDIKIERGIKYDYLLANEIKKGRIVYWGAGHKNTISEDEQTLFINIISWLMKIKQ